MRPLLLAATAATATPIAPANWVTAEDYPEAALRAGQSGKVGFALAVASDGSVTDCTITAPSGSDALDNRTCVLLMARARFEPARSEEGGTVASRYTNTITWSIPAPITGAPVWMTVRRTDGSAICQPDDPAIAVPTAAVCTPLAKAIEDSGQTLPAHLPVEISGVR